MMLGLRTWPATVTPRRRRRRPPMYQVAPVRTQQTRHNSGASGDSYCFVVLTGTENGKKIKNGGVYYNDEYVRCGNTSLIAKRLSQLPGAHEGDGLFTR
jgi:hypothetical protein